MMNSSSNEMRFASAQRVGSVLLIAALVCVAEIFRRLALDVGLDPKDLSGLVGVMLGCIGLGLVLRYNLSEREDWFELIFSLVLAVLGVCLIFNNL